MKYSVVSLFLFYQAIYHMKIIVVQWGTLYWMQNFIVCYYTCMVVHLSLQ